MKIRGSGVLLHISSLPSPFGVGDLGPEAHRFVDFLHEARQSAWQLLPLSPTEAGCGNSPYSSYSAFAGNPLFISLELLREEGLLTEGELLEIPAFPPDRVDYQAAGEYKALLLTTAFDRFHRKKKPETCEHFEEEQGAWLPDLALFTAIKNRYAGTSWNLWPRELRDRDPASLERAAEELAKEVAFAKFLQFVFFRQWQALRRYASENLVQLVGDVPIYVTYDSCDAWTHPHLFKLNEHKEPLFVAGVPPDCFSKTGQRWGNPVYRWEALRETGYQWWIARLEHNLRLFDLVRLDHFRGFLAYWEVPAHEPTAANGQWIEAPADDFFATLARRFPFLPFIAEDLGIITPDVREQIAKWDLPGMRILLFAFGDGSPKNAFLPHNYPVNCVAYTGTHDNNTARGWFEHDASPEEKKNFFRYLGREVDGSAVAWELLRLLLRSSAGLVVTPMQDLLGLGAEARMNFPSTSQGNWGWRMPEGALSEELAKNLGEMTRLYGRS